MPGCIGAIWVSVIPVAAKCGPASGDAEGVFRPPAMTHLPMPALMVATAWCIAIIPDAHQPPTATAGVSSGSPMSRAE